MGEQIGIQAKSAKHGSMAAWQWNRIGSYWNHFFRKRASFCLKAMAAFAGSTVLDHFHFCSPFFCPNQRPRSLCRKGPAKHTVRTGTPRANLNFDSLLLLRQTVTVGEFNCVRTGDHVPYTKARHDKPAGQQPEHMDMHIDIRCLM